MKKLYTPRALARSGKGKNYADGNELHELLVEHRRQWLEKLEAERIARPGLSDKELRVRVSVGNDLGRIILKMVDEIMFMGSYYLYTSEWREQFRHEALKSMLLYCHCYDPDKATRRRQELNASRVKPLAPVASGKQAWNYMSWIANKSIATKIIKLKAAEELAKSVGLGTFDILSIGMAVNDDNDPSISEDLMSELAAKYQQTDEDDPEWVDPIQAMHNLDASEAKEEYLIALEAAKQSILAKTNDPKIIAKLEKRIKDLVNYVENKPEAKKRPYTKSKKVNSVDIRESDNG